MIAAGGSVVVIVTVTRQDGCRTNEKGYQETTCMPHPDTTQPMRGGLGRGCVCAVRAFICTCSMLQRLSLLTSLLAGLIHTPGSSRLEARDAPQPVQVKCTNILSVAAASGNPPQTVFSRAGNPKSTLARTHVLFGALTGKDDLRPVAIEVNK